MPRRYRSVLFIGGFFLVQCSAQDGRQPPASTQAEASTSVSGRPADIEVERDLRVMIGGNFSPDHLGPDEYNAIDRRARANAERYLSILVERVVGERPDPDWLS